MQENNVILNKTYEILESSLKKKIESLPHDFNAVRFQQNAMEFLKITPDLHKYTPQDVVGILLKGAFLGLDFFNRECYAIPYDNSITFQTDYKAEVKLCKKYSIRKIKDIYAVNVRKNDFFECGINNGVSYLNYKATDVFGDSEIIGTFAIAVFKDGGLQYETMSIKEILDIKNNFSKSKNSTMWTKTPGEAYKKTVLKRLTKHIEKEFENQEQLTSYKDLEEFKYVENDTTKSINNVVVPNF